MRMAGLYNEKPIPDRVEGLYYGLQRGPVLGEKVVVTNHWTLETRTGQVVKIDRDRFEYDAVMAEQLGLGL